MCVPTYNNLDTSFQQTTLPLMSSNRRFVIIINPCSKKCIFRNRTKRVNLFCRFATYGQRTPWCFEFDQTCLKQVRQTTGSHCSLLDTPHHRLSLQKTRSVCSRTAANARSVFRNIPDINLPVRLAQSARRYWLWWSARRSWWHWPWRPQRWAATSSPAGTRKRAPGQRPLWVELARACRKRMCARVSCAPPCRRSRPCRTHRASMTSSLPSLV